MHSRAPDDSSEYTAGRLTAETALLNACLRGALPGATLPAEFPDLLARVNWDHLLWLARSHHLLLFLRAALAATESTQRPPAIWAQLTHVHETNQLHSLERARELCLIQEIFERAGIAAVAMSGWCLAQRHHENPGRREVGASTAFLVEPAERARAEAALTSGGYVFEDSLLRLNQPARSRVVFHTSFWEDSGPSFAQIRARADALVIGNRTLPLLSVRDWVYRLTWRGHRSRWQDPRAAFDLSMLIMRQPHLDWRDLLDEARHAGRESHVLVGMQACHNQLGLVLPEPIKARLNEKREAGSSNDLADEFVSPLPESTASPGPVSAEPAPVEPSEPVGRTRRQIPSADTELAYIGRFAPTAIPAVRAMLRLGQAGPTDTVYDLGCGDGRVVITAAAEFGAKGVGIDIDPQRIATAETQAAARGVEQRVTFQCADVLQVPVTGATLVCIYLQGFAYPTLRRKLERELPRGTRLVSHNFIFPGWPPEKTEIVRVNRFKVSYIYLWRTGEPADDPR